MNSSLDTIYAQASDHITDFQFDSKVAGVFGDMIRRSVPGYAQIIATLGNLADEYVNPNTKIYDLGCSLGAASLSIRRKVEGRNAEIIAIDFSQSMVDRCRENLQAYVSKTKVNVIQADIRDIDIENASMVVLNFTLQFLPTEDRDRIINKIYQGMNPGGILVISEKLIFDNATIQNLLDSQHIDFKRANGYSELEISQKRSALENVMKPDTLATHEQRLLNAGFSHFSVWFQCFNFASMVAIK